MVLAHVRHHQRSRTLAQHEIALLISCVSALQPRDAIGIVIRGRDLQRRDAEAAARSRRLKHEDVAAQMDRQEARL
jgi:hypothetical protein